MKLRRSPKSTPAPHGRDTVPHATDFPMVRALHIPHSALLRIAPVALRGPNTRPGPCSQSASALVFHIPHSIKAFSLIEVVLAIGIVSFALLTIIGLFGGMMKSSGDNTQRREMTEAVDSLRSHLDATNFASAYDWTKAGKEFLYVTYKAGSNGVPDPASQTVIGLWTNADATGLEAYEPARSGRWLRAKLSVSPSNPGGTNLPAVGAYTRASLFVLAEIFPVAAPEQQIPANSSRLQATLAILR